MFKNFQPLSDRIFLKRLENQNKTEGGIIIPDTAKEKVQTAEVVATGPGRTNEQGTLIPMTVKKGDLVYFSKYSGTEVDDNHLIVREDDILGIITK